MAGARPRRAFLNRSCGSLVTVVTVAVVTVGGHAFTTRPAEKGVSGVL